MSNHLPLIVKRDDVQGWVFEWDEDALIAQAKEGLPDDMEAAYVGCLPVEVEGHEQDVSLAAAFCGGGVFIGVLVCSSAREKSTFLGGC